MVRGVPKKIPKLKEIFYSYLKEITLFEKEMVLANEERLSKKVLVFCCE